MNKIAVYIVCIAIAVFGLFYLHNKQVDKAVNAAYTQMENESNKRLLTLMKKADAESIELKAKIKEQQDEKQIAIDDINKRHAAIVAGLRNRPERPTSQGNYTASTGNAETPNGATGVELSRPDAEFLAREATRAEVIRESLLQCYRQYDEVKDAIQKFTQDNN